MILIDESTPPWRSRLELLPIFLCLDLVFLLNLEALGNLIKAAQEPDFIGPKMAGGEPSGQQLKLVLPGGAVIGDRDGYGVKGAVDVH